jgi:hypothetical protein
VYTFGAFPQRVSINGLESMHLSNKVLIPLREKGIFKDLDHLVDHKGRVCFKDRCKGGELASLSFLLLLLLSLSLSF